MEWLLHKLCPFMMVQNAEAKTEQNFFADVLEFRKLHDQVVQLCCKLLRNREFTHANQKQLLISENQRIIDMFRGQEAVLEMLDVAERQFVRQLHQLDNNPNATDELRKMLSKVVDTIPNRNSAQMLMRLVATSSISETLSQMYKVREFYNFFNLQMLKIFLQLSNFQKY